ncbi:MAG: M23 family metallopeptidase [Acidobacteria bacterium]|nr:M23 family metallopeptidase [Acidobacteriota bacterium]
MDGGAAFDPNNPQTWYTVVWAGRYSGPAAQRAEGSGGHPGVDIRDRYGEMTGDLGVYAIADGTVIRRRSASGWGNFAAISHDNVVGIGTIYSIYAHLDGFDPSIANDQEGQIQITRGQRIGTMGSTGLDGPAARHLHFQIDRAWPETKNSPFFPSGYPVGDDSGLTPTQLQQAAANVMANTVNPMQFVETGSIGGQTGNARVSISQDCGPPGTAFVLQWTGFTPNSTLTSHLRKPDGTEYPTLQFNTDGQGGQRFTIGSSTLERGTYQHWAVDEPRAVEATS